MIKKYILPIQGLGLNHNIIDITSTTSYHLTASQPPPTLHPKAPARRPPPAASQVRHPPCYRKSDRIPSESLGASKGMPER